MKKVLSILLVLMLCLAMLPMGVMAAGTGIRLGFMGTDNVEPGENFGAGGTGTHPVTVWLDGVQQTNYTAVSGDTGVCTVSVNSDGTLMVQNIAPGTSVLTITVGSQSESFNWYIGDETEGEGGDNGGQQNPSGITFSIWNETFGPGAGLGDVIGGPYEMTILQGGQPVAAFTAVSADPGVCSVAVNNGVLEITSVAPGDTTVTVTVGEESASFDWHVDDPNAGQQPDSGDNGEGEGGDNNEEGGQQPDPVSAITFFTANETFNPGATLGDVIGGPYAMTVLLHGQPVTDFTAVTSDPNVCSVAVTNGVLEITGVAPGDALITVTHETSDGGEYEASFWWSVSDPNAGDQQPDDGDEQPDVGQDSGISLYWANDEFCAGSSFGTGEAGPHTLAVWKDGVQLQASDYSVTSEDESVCTVEKDGAGFLLVTCTGNGETVITVTVGDKSAKFTWCVDGFGLDDDQQPDSGEQQPDMGEDSGIELKWGDIFVQPGTCMSADSMEPNMMTVWLNGERVVNFTVESSDESVCIVRKGAEDSIEVMNGGSYGRATITVTVGDKTAGFEWAVQERIEPEDTQGLILYWDGGILINEDNTGAMPGIHVMTVYLDGKQITDYTVTSANTSICEASRTADGLLVIEAKEAGQTFITVTAGDVSIILGWFTEMSDFEPDQPEDTSGITLTDGQIIAIDGSGFGLNPGGYMNLIVCLDEERVSQFTVTVADESILKARASGGLLILEGLDYGYTTFTITSGGKSATYNWCTSDGDQETHDCSYYITFQEGWEPTCMDIGAKAFYICMNCDTLYADAEGTVVLTEEDVILEPVDHKWYGIQTEDPGRVLFECVFGCGETYEDNYEYHSKLEIGEVEVSDHLKDIGFEKPEDVKDHLVKELTDKGQGHKKENVKVQEVTLMISLDGGKNWQKATEENFPEEGIVVTLPYPEGTDRNRHDFIVAHMFAADMNGHKAGDVEYPQVEETENGIRFTVKGLSPIAVAWKDASATSGETGSGSGSNSSSGSDSNVPDTGDESPVILLAGMLIACAVGAAVVIRKGKKKA